ncbi:hypothetical protein LINPERHAP2_LOCUS42918 [Linum perenne]
MIYQIGWQPQMESWIAVFQFISSIELLSQIVIQSLFGPRRLVLSSTPLVTRCSVLSINQTRISMDYVYIDECRPRECYSVEMFTALRRCSLIQN